MEMEISNSQIERLEIKIYDFRNGILDVFNRILNTANEKSVK